MPGITVNNLTITSIVVGFSGGQIASANVSYVMTGPSGESWSGSHVWVLTAAESASAAATNFVTALVNKVATATGLVVATS